MSIEFNIKIPFNLNEYSEKTNDYDVGNMERKIRHFMDRSKVPYSMMITTKIVRTPHPSNPQIMVPRPVPDGVIVMLNDDSVAERLKNIF